MNKNVMDKNLPPLQTAVWTKLISRCWVTSNSLRIFRRRGDESDEPKNMRPAEMAHIAVPFQPNRSCFRCWTR